jgi:hypothetical protein
MNKDSNFYFRIAIVKIEKYAENFFVQTNFLRFSKITSLLSNQKSGKFSKPIFEKSTKFWF